MELGEEFNPDAWNPDDINLNRTPPTYFNDPSNAGEARDLEITEPAHKRRHLEDDTALTTASANKTFPFQRKRKIVQKSIESIEEAAMTEIRKKKYNEDWKARSGLIQRIGDALLEKTPQSLPTLLHWKILFERTQWDTVAYVVMNGQEYPQIRMANMIKERIEKRIALAKGTTLPNVVEVPPTPAPEYQADAGQTTEETDRALGLASDAEIEANLRQMAAEREESHIETTSTETETRQEETGEVPISENIEDYMDIETRTTSERVQEALNRMAQLNDAAWLQATGQQGPLLLTAPNIATASQPFAPPVQQAAPPPNDPIIIDDPDKYYITLPVTIKKQQQ